MLPPNCCCYWFQIPSFPKMHRCKLCIVKFNKFHFALISRLNKLNLLLDKKEGVIKLRSTHIIFLNLHTLIPLRRESSGKIRATEP